MSSAVSHALENNSFDAIVVGGGMVGATFACALADTGLRIAVIDAELQPAAELSVAGTPARFDSRVSAISPGSRSILEEIGVWEAIARERQCPYTEMHVWEADGTGSIHFSAADIHAAELGYIIENSVLLSSLQQKLQQLPNIVRITGRVGGITPAVSVATTEPGVDVLLEDGRRISSRLAVAADGANSIVRSLAGFQVKEWDYDHHAIVCTVRTSRPHNNTAIQRFMDTGILAFLPLAETRPGSDEAGSQQHCSIVWSVIPERAAQLLAMSDADFIHALQSAIENQLGTIEWVDRRASFPLRQRHARTYVKNNIALIGDAAHSIHPLAGLGVNLGLLDAWSLAGQIRRALQQQRDFASLRILQRYQRERMSSNLATMWMMEGFKRLFADQPLALRWLRNTGMRSVDSLPLLKNRIMRQAMGTTLHRRLPDKPGSSVSALRR